MEHNQALLQAYSRLQRIEGNEGVSVFPQQEQQQNPVHPESIQETLGPQSIPEMLAFIEFRIQQLNNRRFLLMEMQHFKQRSKDSGDETTEETMKTEDSDTQCELDTIQKELEELLGEQEELQKQGSNSKLSTVTQGQQELCPTSGEAVIPSGEIFTVLPLTPEQNNVTETTTERKTGPVIPVDELGQEADVTQCPSCKEVVFTETQRKVGEAACVASCLCAIIGGVAGCCLVPFFLERLRNVHHKCPLCHAHIHTHSPF